MTATATRKVIATASLVASVILANKPPFRTRVLFGSTREAILVSVAGSDIVIWRRLGRRFPCGGEALRECREQSRRPEGFGQAAHRAELGSHRQKVGVRTRIPRHRPAGHRDDR